MTARFYGVGLGPGDPELLTLKACRILEECDVICYPRAREDRDSLALAIVQKIIKKHFELIELIFPMTKNQEELDLSWDEAAAQICAKLMDGKKVAFISIGDPLFFSTYSYVLCRVRRECPDVPVLTVPGVTAFAACTSLLNVPLTEGNEKLVVIPAAYPVENLPGLLAEFENVVLMKVNRYFDRLVDELKKMNFKGKAWFISRVGYPDQFYTDDLECLVGKPLDYMSMVILRRG